MDKEQLLSMDPNILLSLVNMKLRDQFSSLEHYCDDLGIESDMLEDKLKSTGYVYNRERNQFIYSL